MIGSVAFGVVAVCLAAAALLAVRAKQLVHSVLWLGVTLATTSLLFVMLDAAFLAGIQLLLYVGGVMTLMIFGVMLTRRLGDDQGLVKNVSPVRAAIAAAGLFAVLAGAVLKSEAQLPVMTADTPRPADAAGLGKLLLTTNVLAFEVLSALLLAAMVGAIVLARRRDPGTETESAARPVTPAAGEAR